MTKCRDPRIGLLISKLIVAIVMLLVIGCGQEGVAQYQTTDSNSAPQISVIRPALSDAARAGEALFNANCSLCHGVNAEGTLQGPTLIDNIYKPGHHSDFQYSSRGPSRSTATSLVVRRYASGLGRLVG